MSLLLDYGGKMKLEVHWKWKTLAIDFIYNAMQQPLKNGEKNNGV